MLLPHELRIRLCACVFVGLAAAALLGACDRQAALPEPGSDAYREAVVAFHTSLAAMQSGEDLGAADYLHRVTEQAPGEPAAWANLGLLALRRNELSEAETYLSRAAELAPQSGQIRRLQAALYGQRGDFDAAVDALREAVRLQPDDPKALYALVQAIDRQNTENREETAALLDGLREVAPDNLAVLIERARVAALQDDPDTMVRLLDALENRSDGWPAEAQQLLVSTREAARSGDVAEAATQIAFLRNTLLRLPAFRQDLAQIQTPAAQAGDLVSRFLRLPEPQPQAAPADTALAFEPQAPSGGTGEALWNRVFWPGEEAPPTFAIYREGRLHLGEQVLAGVGAERAALAQGGLNFDYLTDLVLAGPEGVRLYHQDSTGAFTEATDGLPAALADRPYTGVWLADVDLEGDIDLVLGRRSGTPVVARNNGDGTFARQEPWTWDGGVRAFAWADLDTDGDPDPAVLDEAGRLGIWSNERQSLFLPQEVPQLPAAGRALHATDLDGDGTLELLVLVDDGAIVSVERSEEEAAWSVAPVVQGPAVGGDAAAWHATADLDNNGMPDVLTAASGQSAAWLSGDGGLVRLRLPDGARVEAVADLDADGRLDLAGLDQAGQPAWWRNAGTRDYHWQQLRLRAARTRGDQRVNAFAYGARAELRSGLLYQQRPVTEPVVHFGLGTHEAADLVRIVWPNGDVQAEFELAADQQIRTPQRLKGSCPWVFTYDGEQMQFVTDFIWRSPLGLRINAQETAGIMATGDWIRIRGDQLEPRDGLYDIRITAELWETHFFDHVVLKVVDHPPETEVLVDERFAFPPPPLALHVTSPLRPVAGARTGSGTDVTDLVRERDDRHVGTFPLGLYQGVAREHVLEVDLDDAVPVDSGLVMTAFGWVRPTDSSINVALSQGDHAPPQGLQVEVPDGRGGWRVLHPNLGFPSGKDKTILIPLDGAFASGAPRRVRLTTNLEVYWDRLAWTVRRDEAEVSVQTLAPRKAELRYRGFSEIVQPNRQTPERPVYDRLAGTAPRWMDLEGYYTRFGDVRPLLAGVDDRYVIMNAGDEFRFLFEAPPPPPEGWTRTFVLAGDGWVKDGDYNTAFSETVLPLPAHDRPAYDTPPTTLEDDPVYQRHPGDWRDYHTRYVAPDRFHRALRP